MAIGHSGGAFATVEAPKVDFGEIALNAQKFQAQDQEMIKSLIPKEKEVKPYEFTPQKVTETSGLNFFNTSIVDKLSNDSIELRDLDYLNKQGKLRSDQVARYTELMNGGANVSATLKAVNGIFSKYTEGIANQSGVFKSTADYLKGYTENNGKNVIVATDKQTGVPYFQQALIVDGKPVIDEKTGKPKIRIFVDSKGVERDGWSYDKILSGEAFTPINKFDMLANSGKIISQIKLKETGSDTGVIKNIQSVITGENKTAIESYIKTTMLDNNDVLADTLYSIDPVKYANPKSSYSAEEKELVAAEGRKQIYGGLGVKNVTDVNLEAGAKAAERKAIKPILTLAPDTIYGILNDRITNKSKGIYSLPGKTTLPGEIDGVVAVNSPSHKVGSLFTVPAGSSLRQVSFDKKGGVLGKVSALVFKGETLSKDKQNELKNALAILESEGATESELIVKARSMGADYESVWMHIPKAAANEINFGPGVSVESLKYNLMKGQPKTKTTGIGGKYNKK